MFGFGKSRAAAALALLFMIALAASCSNTITSADEQRIDVEIRAPLGASGQTAQASTYTLTVTGVGILVPIVAPLTLSDGLLVGNISVPAGPDRTFRIDAYDRTGTLVFSGQTLADVVGGSELKLDIQLTPQVPMITATPVFVKTLQGDLLAVTISVYHLPDVASLGISLSSFRSVGDTYIVTDARYVQIDPQLAKVAASNVSFDANYVMTIDLTLRNPTSRMVDENGYTEIAVVYYQTNIYEVSPYETATFTPSVDYMVDKSSHELSVSGIRAESAVALLYDYWYRRIASWDMGYGAISSVIYDGSGNNLNGTATGTSALDGPFGGLARRFNGSGDFVTVPDNALLDIQNEITISTWVYLPAAAAVPNPMSSLICKRNADGAINYQLLLDDPSTTDGVRSIVFRYGTAPFHTYRVDNLPDNRTAGWFHIVFSYRFGEPSSAMLVLGQGCTITEMPGAWVTGSGEAPPPNTGGPLFMGKDNATSPGYLNGGLYGVELFDIAWTWGVAYYNLFTGCR
jgi:hypothetical protein